MATFTPTQPITAEDLAGRADEKLLEIINEEWIEQPMTGEEHGSIETNLILLLGGHVKANRLGRIYPGDTTFVLEGTPKRIINMRHPDVAFVTVDRVKQSERAEFYYQAPDLAIEIVSPSERTSETRAKLNDYLRFGMRQVWLVYPKTRQVEVYQSDGTSVTYQLDQMIPGGDLLPGFELPVSAIFEE